MRLIEGLISEFAGHLPAGVIIAETVRSRDQLLASGVRSGLVPATEAMTRTRLSERRGQSGRAPW